MFPFIPVSDRFLLDKTRPPDVGNCLIGVCKSDGYRLSRCTFLWRGASIIGCYRLCLLCPTEMEFDLDKALEEVPIHVEDPPPPSATCGDLPPPPTSPDPKSVCLGDLLPVEHTTLEHRTKFRPKPKKRTKPSRAPVGLHQRSIPS